MYVLSIWSKPYLKRDATLYLRLIDIIKSSKKNLITSELKHCLLATNPRCMASGSDTSDHDTDIYTIYPQVTPTIRRYLSTNHGQQSHMDP